MKRIWLIGILVAILFGCAAIAAGGSWWVLGSVLCTYTLFATYWLANGGRFD